MAPIGPIFTPGIAGVDTRKPGVERAREKRKTPKEADAFQRTLDEAELSAVTEVDAAGEIRSVKANESEESREDRAANANYDPRGGSPIPLPRGGALDIEG